MTTALSAFVIGIVVGSVYALLALGLVLIHRTQRVINFAHGEIATVAAYTLFFLHLAGVPYLLSMIAAILAAVLLAMGVERFIARPLRDEPSITTFVATAGFALFLIAAVSFVADANIRIVLPLFGDAEREWALPGVLRVLTPQRLVVLALPLATGAALVALFRRQLGIGLEAITDEPLGARLVGCDVGKMSLLVWAMSGAMAGTAAVVFVPTIALVPGYFTFNGLVPALVAAVLARMTSMRGAVIAGLGLGVGGEFARIVLPPTLPAANQLLVLVVLLGVVLVRDSSLLESMRRGAHAR